MKSSEAREKWCPHVRYDGFPRPQHNVNRDGANSSIPAYSLCVAYLCMMWVGTMFEGDCGLKNNQRGNK